MISPQPPRAVRNLHALTGARFVAAAAVLLCHFGPMAQWPGYVIAHGREAVAFFFVLSGFVLTYNYADRLPAGDGRVYWQFLRARFARVYPVHLLILVLSTFMLWYVCRRDPTQGPGVSVLGGVWSWVENALLIQSYTLSDAAIGYWSGPAWSISCEATFYLAFPLLLWQAWRLPTAKSAAVAAVVLWMVTGVVIFALALATRIPALHMPVGNIDTIIYHAPYLRISEFIIGCLAGLWYVRRGDAPWAHRLSREIATWGALAITTTIAILTTYHKLSMLLGESFLFAVPFAVMIVALASGPTTMGSLLSGHWLCQLGEASFSLYLVHAMPVVYLHRLSGGVASSSVIVAGMLASVMVSLLLFYAVENPCRRWLRSDAKKRPVLLATHPLPGEPTMLTPAAG